jgi:hypothetical protein
MQARGQQQMTEEQERRRRQAILDGYRSGAGINAWSPEWLMG